jgi:hypothetical protein
VWLAKIYPEKIRPGSGFSAKNAAESYFEIYTIRQPYY